jgi:hypothetical protein
MANLSSAIAAKTEQAVNKGPVGASGLEAQRPLYCYQDTITTPAGANTVVDRLRFGALPAGAQILPHLTGITTGHSAAVAGKLVITPVDGSAATEFTGLTISLDSLPARTLPTGFDFVIAKESFIDFVPSSAPSVAQNIPFRARIVYALTH